MREELCKAFCDSLLIRRVPAGLAVSTAFHAPNGDKIGFYIRDQDEGLSRIEDGGIALPSLEADGLDFRTGSRAEAMGDLLKEYGVHIDREGRAFVIEDLHADEIADAAMRFVAFSLRVRDFELMTEARVVKTFRDDVRKLLGEAISDRAAIVESEPITSNLADFPADFVIRAPGRPPVGVYLGTGDNRVLEAVVVQMKALHETRDECSIVALLETGSSITRLVRQQAANRLAAVAEFRGDEVAAINRIAYQVLGQSATLQ